MATTSSTPHVAVSPRPLAVALYKRYPELRSRIVKAVGLYKAGAISTAPTGDVFIVTGRTDIYAVQKDLSFCTCPDFHRAPRKMCKHLLSTMLFLASKVELPGRMLPNARRA